MRRNLVTIKNVHIGLIGQNGLNVQPHVEEAPGNLDTYYVLIALICHLFLMFWLPTG